MTAPWTGSVAFPVVPGGVDTHLVVAGDWHGNDVAAENALQVAASVGACAVLQLGDFGVWPGEEGTSYLDTVSAAAVESDVPVVFIDGNHEDFTQLNADAGARVPWQVRDGVWHAPRGSSWQWSGVRFVACGGATSPDRWHRVAGRSWWPEEEISPEDVAAVMAAGPCDVLVTHDCPSGVPIPGIGHRNYAQAFRSGWPVAELERAWEHRDTLARVVDALTPGHLWHGHFHVRHSARRHVAAPHGDPDVVTLVEGLADDTSGPFHNLMVVRLAGGAVQVMDPGETRLLVSSRISSVLA